MTDALRGSEQRRRNVLTEGLRVQGSVWRALIMRELHTRYGRKGLGYAWLFLEPMLLATLVLMLKLLHERHYAGGIGAVPFVVLGYGNFMMFRSIFNRGEAAVDANKTLLHHRMVSIFDILISRAALEGLATTTTIIIMMSLAILIDMADWPVRPFELLLGMLLLWWFSFATSMLTCAWTYDSPTAQKFVHPISYILLPLSGAFTMVQWMPTQIQQIAVWWPMSNMFEMIRYGQFLTASDKYMAIGYTVCSCVVLTGVGIVSLQGLRRKITI